MTTRPRTDLFKQRRDQLRQNSRNGHVEIGMTGSSTTAKEKVVKLPRWITHKTTIQHHLDAAKDSLNKLETVTRNFLPGFDALAEEATQREIKSLENSIENRIGLCKDCLAKMAQPLENETPDGAKTRLSARQSTADLVNAVSQRYHHIQDEYRKRIEQTKARAKESAAADGIVSLGDSDDGETEVADHGFTGDQMALLTNAEKEVEERARVISQISRDLVDIRHIFVDVSDMVRDHGETLVNIDLNIEKTVDRTGAALEENREAEKHQKSAVKKYWLLLVIALMVVVALGLVITITVTKL